MPTIRVDDEVYAALQRKGVPFVDSPNDVLRRELGLDSGERSNGGASAPAKGSSRPLDRAIARRRTSQEQYRLPILRALVDLGGSADVAHVIRRVDEEMRAALTPHDREDIRSGMVRWEKAANWERFDMVREGLLKADSPRGVWEISEKGRRHLEQRGGASIRREGATG